MSLFRSMMCNDFNDDPFFSNGPMESMHQMESMMGTMMSPFGGMFGGLGIPQLTDGRQMARAPRQPQNMLQPFGFGRSLFPNIDHMFANFDNMSRNPTCHSYASSSVMTYTTDETGKPQVYQASASTRTGPGGVKETRKMVQDSRSGVQKMAIGHHLDERAHVIEREKNRHTGEDFENQEFVNLDEEEATAFNREWEKRAQSYYRQPMQPALAGDERWRERSPASHYRSREPLAITGGPESEYQAPANDNSFGVRGEAKVIKPKRHHHRHGSGSSKSGHSSRSGIEKAKFRPKHETSM